MSEQRQEKDATGPAKEDALHKIRQIAEEYDLTLQDLQRVLPESPEKSRKTPGRALLPRLFAYLGGTFILAGLAVFIGLNWSTMNSAARVIVTMGSGISAFLMALVALTQEKYERAITPLLLIGALLQPTGMLVAFEEFSTGGDWHYAGLIVGAVMALQQGLTFLVWPRTTLLFTTLLFGLQFCWVGFDLFDVDGSITASILGFSLVSIQLGLLRTRHARMTSFWFLAGASAFLYGAFDILEGTVLEIFFLGLTCGMVYLSVATRSRTLLAVGTLGTLAYVGYFTNKHFLESWGWPLALIVLGLVMLGLSAAAFRINQKYIRS